MANRNDNSNALVCRLSFIEMILRSCQYYRLPSSESRDVWKPPQRLAWKHLDTAAISSVKRNHLRLVQSNFPIPQTLPEQSRMSLAVYFVASTCL